MAVKNALFTQSTGIQGMAERAYVFTLWLCVSGGLLVAGYMASLSYGSSGMGLGGLLVLGLAVPIVGVIVGQATKNPLITLLGYLMVVMPLGYMIGPLVAMYQIQSVFSVMLVTGSVAGGMWILGTIMPPITRNLSGYIWGGE